MVSRKCPPRVNYKLLFLNIILLFFVGWEASRHLLVSPMAGYLPPYGIGVFIVNFIEKAAAKIIAAIIIPCKYS